MEATHKDPKTGKETNYEISYSQQLQQQLVDELKKSNKLKIALLVGFILMIGAGALVWFNTGTVGQVARAAICP